ncbi:NTP transferase domain-containing protein [Mobiluncus sp.]|uniref:NTP transferase domain-containing protein n=1 Tax=Mobiluncus sp. TaxID=47293 RepID=UPI002A91EE8C|nr:NTP transferase domain-containing protein [Mobiluncus sp.]MDY6077575.1 NTP transferase domain-containing protein [Mobiluncus sp.]
MCNCAGNPAVVPDAVVILAGGTAKRLGGVSKPDYRVGGTRLIDWVFAEIERTRCSGRLVVVAPGRLSVPPRGSTDVGRSPFGWTAGGPQCRGGTVGGFAGFCGRGGDAL